MKTIIKWLEEHGIDYTYSERAGNKYIDIILETGCIWINDYGIPMKYDKSIRVLQNNRKTYKLLETYAFNRTATLKTSNKFNDILDALKDRFSIK